MAGLLLSNQIPMVKQKGESRFANIGRLITVSHKVDVVLSTGSIIKMIVCIHPQASMAMGQVVPKGKIDEQPLSMLLYLYYQEKS